MTQPPDPNFSASDANEELDSEDPKLVSFLQQYQPDVPESSPELENRILHAVLDQVTQSPALGTSVQEAWRMPRWGIPAAIAATLTLIWGGSQIWRTAKQPIRPEDELEAFVAESWSGAFDPFNDAEADLLMDPLEWWADAPTPSVIAEANTVKCKRSSPCHE